MRDWLIRALGGYTDDDLECKLLSLRQELCTAKNSAFMWQDRAVLLEKKLKDSVQPRDPVTKRFMKKK